jgi:FAD-dependent urate hydroxylase
MDALPSHHLMPLADAGARLSLLAERVAWELSTLAYPARDWVRPRGDDVRDVVVVGGGQCGLALSFALRRARVTKTEVLDAGAPAGIWLRFARMHTLRTPKHVTGPELGIPSLSVRAWFEARYGEPAWAALMKIPRATWQAYLDWLQGVLELPVTPGWRVSAVAPEADDLLSVMAEREDGTRARWLARHVVLATGVDGAGEWRVPDIVTRSLPADRHAHTAQPIDFAALAGRRVAVLGAGASAFDNAAMALEHGAARVDLLARRAALPAVNPYRWMEFFGFLHHFADLPDAQKWRFMRTIFGMNQPPPQETFSRCAAHAAFHLHLGAPVRTLRMEGDAIAIDTPHGTIAADFLIVGTGLVVEPALRPELAAAAPFIARWRDRYAPPVGDEDAALGAFPYLTGDFAFTERVAGQAPWLSRLRSSSFAAMVSTASSGGISTLRPSVDRIARGITRDLFLDQAEADHAALVAYDERELTDLRLASEGTRPW